MHPVKPMRTIIKQMAILIFMHIFVDVLHFILYVPAVIIRVALMQRFDPIQDFKHSRQQCHTAMIQKFHEELEKERKLKQSPKE